MEMEHHGIEGCPQALDLNSWVDGKPASEVRAAGMTFMAGSGVRVQSVYLSY